jgi:cation transport ATPase
MMLAMSERVEEASAQAQREIRRILWFAVGLTALLVPVPFFALIDVAAWLAIAMTGAIVLASVLWFVAVLRHRTPLPAARVVQRSDRDRA